MSQTTGLAENTSRLSYSDLPDEVITEAKTLILDQVGCMAAFATLPWSKVAYRYTMGNRSSGVSTISYYGKKLVKLLRLL